MSHDPEHRVHVLPWLRRIGRIVLSDWLAITLGRHIFTWREMRADELAHELEHVRQWRAFGWRFPAVYAAASLRARRSGKGWYAGNRFEEEARAAAKRLGRP